MEYIVIKWGSLGQKTTRYEFATKAEKEAFKLGIAETRGMDGDDSGESEVVWMEYKIISESKWI